MFLYSLFFMFMFNWLGLIYALVLIVFNQLRMLCIMLLLIYNLLFLIQSLV